MKLAFLFGFLFDMFFLKLMKNMLITIKIPVYTKECGCEKKLSGWLKI
jgi:hypothetical protein